MSLRRSLAEGGREGSCRRNLCIGARDRSQDSNYQSRAATGLSGEPWDELSPLLTAVKEVSDVRGQIAHAKPVQNAGMIRINVRMENARIVEALGSERITEGGLEPHKQAREKIIFTGEDLLREYHRIDKLFGDMIAFVKSAQN